MKIVCESCGAKYSIADDRVQGKVFKIRCKRCSEVIVVRGDQGAGAAQAAPAMDDQNAIWHAVVDGEQAGPYTVAQIAELMSTGRVDWEAYVWAEGFDNWVPMRDVPDLVSQLSGDQAAADAPVYRASQVATLTGQPSMGADPFAEGDQGGGMFDGGRGRAAPDLFDAPAEAANPFSGGGGVVASSPSPRSAPQSNMTGARNENSVLFSLKNLQALATGTPSMAPAPTASPGERSGGGGGGGGGAGFASGEGSGLIDIRALAAATGVSDSGGARDELLTLGSQGGAFGALGSPILAPVASDDDGNKKTLIWAGVAAVVVLAAAAVAIVVILREPAPAAPAVQVAAVPTQAPAAAAAAAVPTPAAPAAPSAPAAQPTEGELAAKAAAAAEAHEPSKPSSSSSRRRTEGSAPKADDAPAASAPASAPAAPAAPAEPAKPKGPRSLDDLLNDAVTTGGGSKPAAAAPAASNLPETPSREQVQSAMGGVADAVKACAQDGQSGVATVSVSVAGESGRVTNAQVSGVTGPIGSCIAQAVRKAQFPKFANKVFKIAYPFRL